MMLNPAKATLSLQNLQSGATKKYNESMGMSGSRPILAARTKPHASLNKTIKPCSPSSGQSAFGMKNVIPASMEGDEHERWA